MRIHTAAFVATALMLASRSGDACVQLSEANKLLGWSADGKLALHVRVDAKGKLEHAEIHPTRFEGWKYIIIEDEGIVIKKVAISKCDVIDGPDDKRLPGKLTEESLKKLAVVKDLNLVPVPGEDGGAGKLTAGYVPAKRYAEHKIEIREGDKLVVTLPVPVWCVGSCLRDEDWQRWGASVRAVAKAGERTLYVLRMTRVCNAANDKDMWMERVIAVPGSEKPPARGRCRGSGE